MNKLIQITAVPAVLVMFASSGALAQQTQPTEEAQHAQEARQQQEAGSSQDAHATSQSQSSQAASQSSQAQGSSQPAAQGSAQSSQSPQQPGQATSRPTQPATADPEAATKPVETLDLQSVALDDALKDKFVAAYTDILEIQTRYTERLEQVNDQTQAMSLQQEAQQEMQGALEENDLTPEEYNHVIQLASESEPLMRDLEQKIADEQQR